MFFCLSFEYKNKKRCFQGYLQQQEETSNVIENVYISRKQHSVSGLFLTLKINTFIKICLKHKENLTYVQCLQDQVGYLAYKHILHLHTYIHFKTYKFKVVITQGYASIPIIYKHILIGLFGFQFCLRQTKPSPNI